MNVQFRFLIVVFLGSFLFTDVALAGWVVTYKDSETGEQKEHYYEKDKANLGGSVFTDNNNIVVDEVSRSYWEGTPRQYCDALKIMEKTMQEQMASLPAQYRPVPISQQKVTRKKIDTRSIAGYSATGYVFFVDGIQSGEFWMSSDSALSGLIALKEAKVDNFDCFNEMEATSLEESALFKKTEKNSFILKEGWREVVSVKRKNLPGSTFEAPNGYKRISDFQQFMDYAKNNQSRSSSNPSPSQFYSGEEPMPQDNYQAEDMPQDNYQEYQEDEDEAARKKEVSESISKDIKKGVGGLLKNVIW